MKVDNVIVEAHMDTCYVLSELNRYSQYKFMSIDRKIISCFPVRSYN